MVLEETSHTYERKFSPVDLRRGRFYRRAANGTTRVRTGLGQAYAINVASGDRLLPKQFRHRSIGGVAYMGAITVLDKVDGWLGRKAEAHGVPIKQDDERLDSDSDKKVNKYLMSAYALRNLAEGIRYRNKKKLGHAAILGLALVATNSRDKRMATSRANAIPGASTKAIPLNQYKTTVQDVGHIIETSPVSGILPIVSEAIYAGSVILGEVGLLEADKRHKTPTMAVGELQADLNTNGAMIASHDVRMNVGADDLVR